MTSKNILKQSKKPRTMTSVERRSHTGPHAPLESPVCSRSPLCNGCPFPGHGFLCWGEDGECMRTRLDKQKGNLI